MQLRHANRRWVICFTNNIVEQDAQGFTLGNVAELFVKHQVNVILICFNPRPIEIRAAEHFLKRIKQLGSDKIMPVEGYLLFDPSPCELEELMVRRVANYNIPKNAPLIIETFM